MPPGVGYLATRLVHRTWLFGPLRRERSSPRRNAEHIVEAFWAGSRFVRPKCLPPNTHSRADALFQDDSCSTTTHDLLCVGGTGVGKYWFMTAVEDWLEVTEYLRVKDGSKQIPPRSMSIEELSKSPFNIYIHRQRKGDLVIVPPRRFDRLCSSHPSANSCPAFPKRSIEGSPRAFVGSV